jgi:NTE family protein
MSDLTRRGEAREPRRRGGAADSVRFGLALGGGGALGLAHIGVLKVLEEAGIRPYCVAGTSAGSIVGAAICAGWTWREIRERAQILSWQNLASIVIPRKGIMRLDRMEEFLEEQLGVLQFSDLAIPFAAVATDLAAGEPVVFDTGRLAPAVRASCSVPGVFEPFTVNGRVLVDGGLVNDVPADVARRLGADVVLGVNLNTRLRHSSPPRNIIDVVYYSLEILVAAGAQKSINDADVVVSPQLEGFHYRDLGRVDELVQRGEEAMRSRLDELLQHLRPSDWTASLLL